MVAHSERAQWIIYTIRGDTKITTENAKIIYTLTDEAPLLATYSLLPIIRTFTSAAGIDMEESDISVAARIIAEFSDYLTEDQKVADNLAELGHLTQEPDTNIIKLPNISASQGQLQAAISELQAKGYKIPDYPEEPKSEEDNAIKARYSKIQGSAVNPVLREGNSDRRAPAAVKRAARKNPHSMAKWSPASRTHVSHMHGGDFYSHEKVMTMDKACDVRMELVTKSGETIVLKEKTSLLAGEIIDGMYMSKKQLCDFYESEMEDARETGVMFSLHVKATMMKVSHPSFLAMLLRSSTRICLQNTVICLTNWGSTRTTASAAFMRRFKACLVPFVKRLNTTSMPVISTALSWQWSTQQRASPIYMPPMMSSLMRQCRR